MKTKQKLSAKNIQEELKKKANKSFAERYKTFFKTGKGEYGEGDIFIGVPVPEIRRIVKKYYDIPFKELQKLLENKIHEYRFAGLVILNKQMERAIKKKNSKTIQKITSFYLKNTRNINNWDLVDISCPNIIGVNILFDEKERKILYTLAKSKDVWEKRISVVSTLKLVRAGNISDAIKLCKIHLYDEHNLINKAVGWVVREIGKQDEKELIKFLEKYSSTMPRTTLRYAIERLDKNKRKYFMTLKEN